MVLALLLLAPAVAPPGIIRRSLLGPPAAGAAQDPFRALDLIRPARPFPAKSFTVPNLTATPLRLGDFNGKIVFLNFWATWCPPCKEEMPSMERLYRRYRARGFTIVAISIDAGEPDKVRAFVKRLELTFPIGLDPNLTVANDYAVRGLPASFLIDRQGQVVALALGARDWDSEPARALIEALLR